VIIKIWFSEKSVDKKVLKIRSRLFSASDRKKDLYIKVGAFSKKSGSLDKMGSIRSSGKISLQVHRGLEIWTPPECGPMADRKNCPVAYSKSASQAHICIRKGSD
jgi:hypothetical protein